MDVPTTPTVPQTEYFPPPRAPAGPSRWLATVRDEWHELIRFWPVVQNMVVQDLRVRYQRSMLGFFWSLLNPILMMVTLTLVFSQLWRVQRELFAIYLFAGMLPWGFLSSSLGDCAYCIIFNEGLIRKIYLPKLVFPLARTLINLTTFVLSMGALFLLLGPLGARFSLPMVLLPLVMALLFAFVFGLGLIVATTNTFFRDCGHLVSVIVQAWYFLTPILYPKSLLGDAQWLLWLNPAYPFIQMFQDIIKDGAWPAMPVLLVATAIAAVSLGAGYAAFKCHEDKLVFRL
jgi:ABC-2 type transport system permease protein/lipopolysaccharide transport system permease protein